MAQVQFNRALQLLVEVMIVLGVLATAIAPVVLAIEIGEWLLSREWPGWSVEDGLGLFGIERGETAETPAQRLLDVVMAIPLTLALFMIGINLFLGGLKLGDWGLTRERNAAGVWAGRAAAPAQLPRAERPSRPVLPILRVGLGACARGLAARAAAREDYNRAIELFGVMTAFRPLSAIDHVRLAMLLLHARRTADARRALSKFSARHSSSREPNIRYLRHYCEAMLGMIDGDTVKVIHEAKRAGGSGCERWLRDEFPLPEPED
jgi:hypothetical protein